jgi:hypothetical protein
LSNPPPSLSRTASLHCPCPREHLRRLKPCITVCSVSTSSTRPVLYHRTEEAIAIMEGSRLLLSTW